MEPPSHKDREHFITQYSVVLLCIKSPDLLHHSTNDLTPIIICYFSCSRYSNTHFCITDFAMILLRFLHELRVSVVCYS